jgi:hypothetical protein
MNWFRRLFSFFVRRTELEKIEPILSATEIAIAPEIKPKISRPQTYTHAMKLDVVNSVVDFMEQLNNAKSLLTRNLKRKSLGFLEAADYHARRGDYLLLDSATEKLISSDDKTTPLIDADPEEHCKAMPWKIDIGVCYVKEGTHTLMRLTEVTKEEVCSVCDPDLLRLVDRVFYLVSGGIMPEGIGFIPTVMGIRDKVVRDVTSPNQGGIYRDPDTEAIYAEKERWRFNTCLSAAFTVHLRWHVAFGPEDGIRILMPTPPGGALKLFKDRNKKGSRREKLRHWVEEHWRETKESLAFVCSHLRGQTKFEWYGLNCEILVSQEDLDKNEFFKHQADDWRAKRPTNSLRARRVKKKYSDRLSDRYKGRR